MSPGQSAPDRRRWLRCASLMLMLVGALNVVSGVVALRNHQFLSHKQLLFSEFTVRGWFFVGWGIIQILAAMAIARRVFWAVYVGIVSASQRTGAVRLPEYLPGVGDPGDRCRCSGHLCACLAGRSV